MKIKLYFSYLFVSVNFIFAPIANSDSFNYSVEIVDYFPDYTVEIVDYFPDKTVEIVDYYADKKVCITNPSSLDRETLIKLRLR